MSTDMVGYVAPEAMTDNGYIHMHMYPGGFWLGAQSVVCPFCKLHSFMEAEEKARKEAMAFRRKRGKRQKRSR